MIETIRWMWSLLLVCTSLWGWGQDTHLSQFESAPVYMNAANIGNFEGKGRLFGVYRSQWASLGSPFMTTSAIADFKLGPVGIGVEFLTDDAGLAGLKHTQALLGFGYRIPLGEHLVSLGLKAGFVQKSFDPNQLTFDTQYNPSTGYNPNVSSGEIFPSIRTTLGDFHSGIAYDYQPESAKLIQGAHIGIGFSHINQAVYTLISDEAMLPMKTNIFGRIDLLAGERLVFSPTALWMRQGSATEITFGAILNYEFDQEVFGQIGVKYRLNDALIPFAGLTFNQMHIGLSYDVTLSLLSSPIGMRGGPELVLSYTWNKKQRPKTNYKARKARLLNDQDGDGIKDARDACPDIPGIRKFRGCPDSDGDGIVDSEDLCPVNPGPKERNGCPALDRDGDGVLDKADDCPDHPGLIAFKGCPDTDSDGLPDPADKCPTEPGPRIRSGCPSSDIDADGDGIPNKVDMCPTVYGTTDLQGCPENMQDADKDGILDKDDKCPMVAGLPHLQGCPDTDKDGISDFEDKCPLTAGLPANQGCPDGNMDVDGDGILNPVDRCPYVPGLAAFKGCPDTDKDGLSDLDDACPLIHGPTHNKGCPLSSNQAPGIPEAWKGLPRFGPVFFDTDQAIIKPEYYSMLNEMSEYMLKNPEIKLLIAGHTDDRASSMYNMVLGQNRAKAIQYYLTIRGIDNSRLSIVSYGEIMPQKLNKDEQGRASNRRAEFRLSR